MKLLNPLVDMTQLIVEFKIRALEEGRVAKWIATCTRKPTLYRIQSECRKIRTRKTPDTDTFYAVFLL